MEIKSWIIELHLPEPLTIPRDSEITNMVILTTLDAIAKFV